MASESNCHFPYTDAPLCDQTFADSFEGYKTFQAIYASFTAVTTVVTVIQTARIVRSKGGFFPVDLQRYLHYVCCLGCLSFIIRSIDPLDWQGIIPHRLYIFAVEFCTSIELGAVLAVVISWVKIILKINAGEKSTQRIHRLRIFKRIAQPSIVIVQIFVSQMGLGPGPTWVWNSILFSLYPFFIFCITVIGVRYGVMIYGTLQSLHSTESSSPSDKKEAEKITTDDFSESSSKKDSVHSSGNHPLKVDVKLDVQRKESADASARPKSPKEPKKKQVSDAGKRVILRRLAALFTCMVVGATVCIVVELLQISTFVASRYDEETKPRDRPSSISGSVQFEILQWAVAACTLFFFRAVHQPQSSKFSNSQSEVPASPRKKVPLSPST